MPSGNCEGNMIWCISHTIILFYWRPNNKYWHFLYQTQRDDSAKLNHFLMWNCIGSTVQDTLSVSVGEEGALLPFSFLWDKTTRRVSWSELLDYIQIWYYFEHIQHGGTWAKAVILSLAHWVFLKHLFTINATSSIQHSWCTLNGKIIVCMLLHRPGVQM